ncbi:1-deoxy-D-xylulose-5-phosphate reductoisomerase [Bacilliculturomica massiliensis]|uniref:1-deoxy-D-xylulose-5-phosphate reductoisomerase n=1 Tax=Bacilliculturomica massiliensis TaxID=1917867 RepID=UPI001031C529|nr:1-deoxy-D-xylulose-5-phosphate reductoisomerase [Bacilliculturomica massiliensis]
MKNIAVLGSTGSIGTQALDVAEQNRERFRITALTCGRNIELFRRQLARFSPRLAVTARREDAERLSAEFPGVEFSWGMEGLIQAAAESDSELVLNALMGMMGLTPTYHAIKAGKDIALANKETLVAGGQVILSAVRKAGVRLLPVDSEHSAIFQCVQGNEQNPVERILLTASGGPFRGWTRSQLENVTLSQALKHPNWVMGRKITIDSATLMNKGLEVIEAKWLFDIDAKNIQVHVHPQSIVHSMVEFADHSVMAQLGAPDMRIPIAYAFSYPERLTNDIPGVDFFQVGALTFEPADMKTFRCLAMAYEAVLAGGSCPVVLNAANEVLVDDFLKGKISFLDIQEGVERALQAHKPVGELTLEGILEIDEETRRAVSGGSAR